MILQADVYINSTNTNLDLKTGTLSKVILEKCGEKLQKKCSEYAPLKPEQVAVTEAEKLKAKSIYHIALPDYQPDHHSAMRVRGWRHRASLVFTVSVHGVIFLFFI